MSLSNLYTTDQREIRSLFHFRRRGTTRARRGHGFRVKPPERKHGPAQPICHDGHERNGDRDQEHVLDQGLSAFGIALLHPFYFRLESVQMATASQTPESVEKKPRKKPGFATVLIPVAVILATVLVGLAYVKEKHFAHPVSTNGQEAAPAAPRKIGEAIPDFTLKTLDGKETKLSEIKGKVTLINFWATWCGPCVKEMPSLQKLSDAYASKGLNVIGVNLDENPDQVLEPFLKKNGIKFKSYVDPHGESADLFQVSGLPLTLVVDSQRKLLLEQIGDEEWFDPDFRKQFETWLGGGKQ